MPLPRGRPKGAQNKTTLAVKEALVTAFEKRGGVAALLKWANENETEFYKLWGRLIPTEVSTNTVTTEVYVVQSPPKFERSDTGAVEWQRLYAKN